MLKLVFHLLIFRLITLFRLWLLLLFLFLGWGTALSMTSKVRVLAFKAFVVIKVVKGKFRQVFKILAFWVFETLIKVKALMLCS